MQFCFYATEIYASRDVFAMCFHVAFCCITPQERPFKKPQARVYGSYPVVGITSGKSVSRVCLLCRCVSLGGVFLYLLDVGSWFRFSPETPEHLLPALVGFSFPYDVRFCYMCGAICCIPAPLPAREWLCHTFRNTRVLQLHLMEE